MSSLREDVVFPKLRDHRSPRSLGGRTLDPLGSWRDGSSQQSVCVLHPVQSRKGDMLDKNGTGLEWPNRNSTIATTMPGDELTILSKQLDEQNQYARTNIQLLVQWFIFFATANYVVLAYFALKLI